MPAKIPAHTREQQINALPNIMFVRWDGEYRGKRSRVVCRCTIDGFEWVTNVDSLVHGGSGCPHCAGVRRWTSSERVDQINSMGGVEFVRWCGTYVNCYSKCICRCTIDGFEWSTSVNSIINSNKGCPQCSGKRRWTADEREQQINSVGGLVFVRWVAGFNGSHSKAECVCESGHHWTASVNNLVNQHQGCPHCAGTRKRTSDECIVLINSRSDLKFVRWDGDYQNKESKAVCKCVADHEWSASVGSLVNNGSGCPSCAKTGYNPEIEGTLYALRSDCGTMVKIGISNNYKRRHAALRRDTPFPWNCIELLHGDGALIVSLEKAFHGMTEPVEFAEPFHGYTEWRRWTPELVDWFNTWREMT